MMKDIQNEEKKEFGILLNELRELFNSNFDAYSFFCIL